MSKSESPLFIVRNNSVISVDPEALTPNQVIQSVRELSHRFTEPEKHIKALQHTFDLHRRILIHGGTISSDGETVRINGSSQKERPAGRVMEPNLAPQLAYGLTRPNAKRPSVPVFFLIDENKKMKLFEPRDNWLSVMTAGVFRQHGVRDLRFSTVSLTRLNLIHIAKTQGKGKVR